MVTEALLTLTLAAPPDTSPDDNFDVARAELTTSGGDLLLVGYDDAGAPVGTVALWMDEEGAFHLESDYSDGYASTVVRDGQDHTDATLPAAVFERRAQLMVDRIDAGPREGALGCAVRIALATGLCVPLAAGNPVGVVTCPAGVIYAFCECAPLVGLDGGGICEDL